MSKKNRDESLNNFRQLISQYDQEIIQPIINEVLANFEDDYTKFQVNNEAWQKLAKLEKKIYGSYNVLQELMKGFSNDPKFVHDEISIFFPKEKKAIDFNDIELLHEYKKILSDTRTKCDVLRHIKHQMLEEKPEFKPIHFIFSFIHDARKIEELIVKYNLKIDIESEYLSNKSDSVIYFAAQMDNTQGLELLINKYQVNDKETLISTIDTLIKHGHINSLTKIFDFVTEYSSYQNDYGNNFGHSAAHYGWPKIIAKMVENNMIDFSLRNKEGYSILHVATIRGSDMLTLKILIDYFKEQTGFDINQYDQTGRTLLHHAAFVDNKYIVRFLLADGANVNIKLCYVDRNFPHFLSKIFSGSALNINLNQGGPYIAAKYLLEYGANTVNIVPSKDLFDITIYNISHHFKDFASDDKSSKFRDHGIFNNSKNIIGFIKNWSEFDWFYKEYSSNNFNQQSSIIEINEEKILEAQHLIKNIIQFFHNRQDGLNQLLEKGKLKECNVDRSDGNNYEYTKTAKMCKKKIDWQKLESNLFFKIVMHDIMSGKIALCDENTDSNKITEQLGLFAKLFLFHRSSFINKELQYQGELVDVDKSNLIIEKCNIINNIPKNNHENDYDLYPINENNYQAIERWKNENFFEIIGLKKKNHNLTIYIEAEQNETGEREIDEVAMVVWGSNNLLAAIASFCKVEQYYKSLNESKNVNPSSSDIIDIAVMGQNSEVDEANLAS